MFSRRVVTRARKTKLTAKIGGGTIFSNSRRNFIAFVRQESRYRAAGFRLVTTRAYNCRCRWLWVPGPRAPSPLGSAALAPDGCHRGQGSLRALGRLLGEVVQGPHEVQDLHHVEARDVEAAAPGTVAVYGVAQPVRDGRVGAAHEVVEKVVDDLDNVS